MFFTEELRYAKNLGCTVQLFDGLAFDRGRPFDEYVDTVYEARRNATSSSAKSRLKLLLNSLYGKFGRNPERFRTETVSMSKLNDIAQYHAIEGLVFHENSCSVTYDVDPDITGSGSSELLASRLVAADNHPDTEANVAIAAAITAYARLKLHRLRTVPDNTCAYSDTDSVVLQKPVDPSWLSSELGGLKLECQVGYGVFAAPKVYAIRNDDGDTVKFKGISKGMASFDHVEALFKGDTVQFEVVRWKRRTDTGVCVNPTKYTVKPTGNEKRIKIYDDNGT